MNPAYEAGDEDPEAVNGHHQSRSRQSSHPENGKRSRKSSAVRSRSSSNRDRYASVASNPDPSKADKSSRQNSLSSGRRSSGQPTEERTSINGDVPNHHQTTPTSNGIHHRSLNDSLDSLEQEDLDETPNGVMAYVEVVQDAISRAYSKYQRYIWYGIYGAALLAVHIYLAICIAHSLKLATGFLVMVCLAWTGVLYFFAFKPYLGDQLERNVLNPANKAWTRIMSYRFANLILGLLILAAVIVFLIVDTRNDRSRLEPLLGYVVFLLILFIFSTNPSRVKWRPVLWGLGLQFCMGLLVLRWSVGSIALNWASNQIVTFLDYTNNGTKFVWGFIADPSLAHLDVGGVFAFTVLQVIIYFGSIVSVLYYLGIMQFVLTRLGWLMQITMGTTGAESLDAVACIFLGQTEAPIMIKPYLRTLTLSELHAIMTVGYACVAGSLFAAYISFGACPGYVLSATVMNAPCALGLSKLICPETKKSKQKRVEDLDLPKGEENNVIECISNGAVNTVHLVWAICANLVVFLALLAFIDAIIVWLAGMVGNNDFNFQALMGYVFYPVASVMGAGKDTMAVAQLIGTKTVLNEFIAYQKLQEMVKLGQIGPRGGMLATYALCGFSNLSSIGIQLGTLGGMCEEKKPQLSQIAIRALITGMLTDFCTACIAGVLIETPQSTCAGSVMANSTMSPFTTTTVNSTFLSNLI